MYVETFDVISADFHCGNFVWVSHIPCCAGRVCSVCALPEWHPHCLRWCQQIFKHLSERQLPCAACPSGILKVQIDGWCVGSDVQHGLTKSGYIIFMRDDVASGAKKALSVWFQDEVVFPLLREGREKDGWVPGTPQFRRSFKVCIGKMPKWTRIRS